MEEEDKDIEIGGIVLPPSPLSRTIFMSNSGKSLLVSSPTSNKKKKKSSDDSMKSYSLGSYSFNNIYPNQSFDIDDGNSPSTTGKALVVSSSAKSFALSDSCKSLALSESGKRIDQKKKYVKQVTGKHKDTELHLAAQKGDIKAVKDILEEIDAQMTRTTSGAEFDSELIEIRLTIVNEVNELGETPLFRAAEKGHLDVLQALLPYTTSEGISTKNQVGFTALHVAASQGHEAIVQTLLDQDPDLCNTMGQSNVTPLISAAIRGHLGVVKVLLSQKSNLLEMPKSNGKNALHLSARQGHVDIVRALLKGNPQLARRTDKKGQTALHMAVKGHSAQVVRLLLRADPSIIMLLDKFGNAALHVATRKKRVEIVNELLLLSETDVNALTRDRKTAMDIVEGLPLSIESSEIKGCLMRYGGVKADDLNQSRDELRKTVTEIQKDVHTQLEQTRRTNQNVNGIAKELKKLHREGINNATNSVTVVAVLFATVAFAAIFTVPGGDYDSGVAVVASNISFKIFFIFNAIALFTSLSVVVVQITVVRGETKSERKVIEVINKLMWLASVCTSVSFISSSYIVVGRHHSWAAIFVTVLGAGVMAGVLGTMTYYVVKYKKIRKVRKKEKSSTKKSHALHDIDVFSEDSAVNAIYAI
ncbi:ankyrin repeat-containing protein ITN1-like [Chenopodium quinoa]|uniref:PGG domain-containing protein n=2 Tax=Chenopodium quinoa TaxID=63459 RepID=A0A803NAU1_CHEQI|nr:ankyrin repeat-containing protein ITN1-like [Chenopodium quinoa]